MRPPAEVIRASFVNPTGIESVVPRVILILRSEEIPFPSDRNSPSGFRRETSPLVELYFSGISIRKRVAASLRELVSTCVQRIIISRNVRLSRYKLQQTLNSCLRFMLNVKTHDIIPVDSSISYKDL